MTEVGSALSPTHQLAERETIYQSLIANYRPPVTLRTNHKIQLKTAWSIRQGYGGTKLACDFCKKVVDFAGITVHHGDGNEQHNQIENLSPACWECNRKEGWVVRVRKKAEAATLERERLKLVHAPEPSGQPLESESLMRHKRERMGFNLWLYHPVKGIATQGTILPRMGMAMKAVDIVGIGSYKTYLGYIDEDIAGEYWMKFEDAKTGTMIERTAKPFPLERLGMRPESPHAEEQHFTK